MNAMKLSSMMKEKRNNDNHPWKKPFSWKQAQVEKERRKEIEKIESKYDRKRSVKDVL